MTDDGPERRRFSRVPFVTRAQVEFAGDRFEGQMIDLSMKGALLEIPALTDITAEDHPAAAIRFHLTGSDIELAFQARLVHHHDQLSGFLFSAADLDSMTHLRTLLELNTGDPELVERELEALIHED